MTSCIRALTLGLLVVLLLPFSQRVAAEEEEVVEEIVVTGSRIKRSDFTSASPITVLSGESILDSGAGDLGEALRRAVVAGSQGTNQQSVLSGGGATAVDLRNLGADRVLILINGKRVARFADALANEFADLTFLPNAMVDRVEILRDGASASYGSDAITGVINVILKDNFDGVEASVIGGMPEDDGGEYYGASLTMGATSDRGSVMLGAEYRYRNNIPHRNRDWAFPSVSFIGSSFFGNGSSRSPGGIFFDDNGTTYCTVPRALGGDERTVVTSVPRPGTTTSGCGYRISFDAADRGTLINYDYTLEQDIVNAFDIYSFAGYGNYSLTDSVEVFTEVQYAKRLSESRLDGNPLFGGTPGVPNGWQVPGTNPNLLPGMLGGTYGIRPTTTIGIRDRGIESNTIRLVAGLRGDVIDDASFLNNWSWELSYLYTRVNADVTVDAIFNLNRANIISDPARCAADSVCSQVVNPSGALDVLRPANWTQDEIDYLKQISTAISKFQTVGYYAVATGPVFELPAGEVELAIGAEQRTDEGYAKPDSVTLGGESIANQTFISDGSFDVREVFAEIEVPLVADAPFAQYMTLNGQVRWADYSNFGEETVWRVGLDWAVFEDLRVRANVSTAYRAPTVTDLFGGGTVSYDDFPNDPCADANLRASNPTVDSNCTLDGLAPGFVQTSFQFPVLRGSNANLIPESADTSSIGVVYTPSWLQGLSLTVDYWDIEVEDLIGINTSASIVRACYEGPANLAAPECDLFSRDFVNLPAGLENRLQNLSKVSTDGYDLRAVYETELIEGTLWRFDLNGTYMKENTFSPGQGNFDPFSGSFPRIQGAFRTDVIWNEWEFSWLVDYTHGGDDPAFDGNNIFGYDSVESHTEHDIRVAYNFDQYRVLVGINDVTDEDPPFAFDSSTNTDPNIYDAIGRFMFVRISANL